MNCKIIDTVIETLEKGTESYLFCNIQPEIFAVSKLENGKIFIDMENGEGYILTIEKAN